MKSKSSKSRTSIWINSSIIVLALLIASGLGTGCSMLRSYTEPQLTNEERASNLESFELVWSTIRDKHWDPDLAGLDWQAVHDQVLPQVEQARTSRQYDHAIRGMLKRFEQSHFALLPKDVYKDMNVSDGKGKRDGKTGIKVRFIGQQLLVTEVEKDSSAAKMGIQPGWEIRKIDGDSVAKHIRRLERVFKDKPNLFVLVSNSSARNKLRGEGGTNKTIVFRDGSNRTRKLDVPLLANTEEKYRLGAMPGMIVKFEARRLEGNIGYITFDSFMDPVRIMPQFEKAIKSFADCDGIIIDVRGNLGGLPGIAMGIAGWLVDDEQEYFGTLRTRDSELRLVVNPRLNVYQGKVAILIDGMSVSCAEIFPAGLRDMGRAQLFGTITAGQVLAATFMDLPNGYFLMFPFADYISKNGDRFEGIGVTPDVEVDHTRADLLSGRDNALHAAMLWINEETTASDSDTLVGLK